MPLLPEQLHAPSALQVYCDSFEGTVASFWQQVLMTAAHLQLEVRDYASVLSRCQSMICHQLPS